MNQFPPNPRFEFFQKFAEIFAAQGAPLVSLTPVWMEFATGVVDAGGEFATGIVDSGGVDTLTCDYLREFSEKLKMILMLFSGGLGEDDLWKKLKLKNLVVLSL